MRKNMFRQETIYLEWSIIKNSTDGNEKFLRFIPVNVCVNGLYICVCPEYLMAIADFFVKGLPSAPPAQPPPAIGAQPSTQPQPQGRYSNLYGVCILLLKI